MKALASMESRSAHAIPRMPSLTIVSCKRLPFESVAETTVSYSGLGKSSATIDEEEESLPSMPPMPSPTYVSSSWTSSPSEDKLPLSSRTKVSRRSTRPLESSSQNAFSSST